MLCTNISYVFRNVASARRMDMVVAKTVPVRSICCLGLLLTLDHSGQHVPESIFGNVLLLLPVHKPLLRSVEDQYIHRQSSKRVVLFCVVVDFLHVCSQVYTFGIRLTLDRIDHSIAEIAVLKNVPKDIGMNQF